MIFKTGRRLRQALSLFTCRRGMPGDSAGLDEVIALAEAHGTAYAHLSHYAFCDGGNWTAGSPKSTRRISAAHA
jgi:hypothetical protein